MRRVTPSKLVQVRGVLLARLQHNSNSNSSSSGGGVELPDPPYALPASPRFATERSGGFDKKWLQQLPAYKPLVRNGVYLPSKEDLWKAPAHEGLEIVMEHLPYHDALRYIMEHNYFFLFETLLKAGDAPLPHVMYEDFMKCRTFASLQNPPEEQFALPPTLLRALLCMAAYQTILDPHYFTTCRIFFQRLEQQQTMTPEVLSAWVYCCTTSGKVDDALTYARHMAEHEVPFDETVFSLMQHPSVNPVAAQHRAVPHSAKGLLLQRRLSGRLQTVYRSDSVAAHGMFVFYALTLSHVKKWEVVRAAASLGITLPERTLSLAVEVYAREKGLRCGPKTVKALAMFLAREGAAGQLLYVLLRARKNELLPEFQGLPQTVFGEEEKMAILQCVERRAQHDNGFRAATPLVRALVREDDPRTLFRALARTARESNNSSTSGCDGGVTADAEQSLSAVVVSVQSLLRDVDALDKASRGSTSRGHQTDEEREGVEVVLPRGEEGGVAGPQELEERDMPAGVRELVRLHLAEAEGRATRAARLPAAWVNPDAAL
ncbi:hypothetical protein DQ04_05641020 [Trypanosoma grayi]|uniref:hypothetical protein n=1 Tax=Trypanosoma grayi TaxID=71804 RepID=UPI0004F45984|nr:hypothetical protein DQ04_05641020 [Trypanosoma grayi]KEG09192.1 hypothetical protein DQ04_05641020 [Trypanosoma grayi]